MKTYIKSFFKEVSELIKSESGEFQPYDRKVELLNPSASDAGRASDKPATGRATDIYLQSSRAQRR
jgi:hypothetical protein